MRRNKLILFSLIPVVCVLAALAYIAYAAPTVSISSPIATTYNNSTIVVNYTASGASQCLLEIDGANESFPLCSNVTLTYVHYNNTDPSKILALDFSEGSGTTAYDKGSLTLNGTLGPAVTWNASGKTGYGVSFGSISTTPSANLSIPYNSAFNFSDGKNITIMGWVYFNDLNNPNVWQIMISKGYTTLHQSKIMQFNVAKNSYNQLSFQYDLADVAASAEWDSSPFTFSAQKWYHWAVTFHYSDNSSIHAYINGTEVAGSWSTNTGVVTNGTSEPVYIGSYNDPNNLNGTLDDVAIWNRTLSTSEIWNIYNGAAFNGTHTLRVWANDTSNAWSSASLGFGFPQCSIFSGMSYWNEDMGWNCTISGASASITQWNITSTSGGTMTISNSNITYTNRTIGSLVGTNKIILDNGAKLTRTM